MRDAPDEVLETGPEINIMAPPPETPEQKAYRLSTEWVLRCSRDTARLHLDVDRLRLLWARMANRLPDLRGCLATVRAANAAAGCELTTEMPPGLRQERLLAGLIHELELADYLPRGWDAWSKAEAAAMVEHAPPVPVRARVSMYEGGAWEVHAARSALEPAEGAQHVDYWLSSSLLEPAKVEVPAYAIMTEVME